MPQKFAFTTAAMATALEETSVSYEDLAAIERAFDDVETEIIRQQVTLTTPLYETRTKTLSQIPNFWPLVLEQAPPDIDQYIQPSDSALLLSSLTSLSVSHFEIAQHNNNNNHTTKGAARGDPRSVAIRWEFSTNEYFEDAVLEKRFWYRKARDGWAGLVSEPVSIRWKKDRDLTGGLLDLVCKAWASEGKDGAGKGGLSPEQRQLKKKIENTGMGGLSFFAWFGFIGRRVSAEESREVVEKERVLREEKVNGEACMDEDSKEDTEDEEEEGDEELRMELEIFPDGDDLAIAITEDLWPGAIKYFTQAQEQDALSDADFESDDDELTAALDPNETSDDESEVEGGRPAKKQRSGRSMRL